MNATGTHGGQAGAQRSGLVIVDKPAGWTSHDVVARLRRLAGTRRVGHGGTLDPMATGVLVVGIEKATKLFAYLSHTEKTYEAVIRLGRTTDTDDAEGRVTGTTSAAGVGEDALRREVVRLTGRIEQTPPQVSAVKVDGERAYRRARAGEEVALKPRPVTVYEFTVDRIGHAGDLLDVEATITCSGGTYIRALARDLGAALGVGGHLAALRRTRVGPYDLSMAHTVERLAEKFEMLPMEEAVAAAFPRREVSEEDARKVLHGGRLPAVGAGPGPVGVFDADGTLLALVEEHGPVAKPRVVFGR